MIDDNPAVVIVTVPGFVAGLADSGPVAAHRFVICTPTEFHLVHAVLLAEQSPTVSAVYVAIHRAQSLSARRIRTNIETGRSLPVAPCYEIVGINGTVGERFSDSCAGRWERLGLVRFKDVKPSQLLVDHGEGLEALRFEHLLVKPRFDFVLGCLG